MNFKSAFKNIPLSALGMFAAKWAAKRGTPNALESDPSTWDGMTYLKGGLGAAAAGYLANMVRPGSGQKVLEGGLTLLLYKAAQNHLIPKNNFLTNQFGASSGYQPGDVEVNEAGEPFILGQDGQSWIPMDDQSGIGFGDYGEEIENWEMMGLGSNALEPPGPLGFADVLETPGRLGAPVTQAAYNRAILQR